MSDNVIHFPGPAEIVHRCESAWPGFEITESLLGWAIARIRSTERPEQSTGGRELIPVAFCPWCGGHLPVFPTPAEPRGGGHE